MKSAASDLREKAAMARERGDVAGWLQRPATMEARAARSVARLRQLGVAISRCARWGGRGRRRAVPRTLEAVGYDDEFVTHPRRPRAQLLLRRLLHHYSNLLSF
uniref:Uncharacterized protein n=2 Tax=Oryza meridionalis TaxID=40149 RepID=A0A0E0E4P4_9ORYZ